MPLSDEPSSSSACRAAAAQPAGAGAAANPIGPALTPFGVDSHSLHASRRRERLGLGVAVMIASLMHVTLLYALTRQGHEYGPAGAGGVELDAISVEVELVPSRALQSRADTAAPASGVASTLAPNEGGPEMRRTRAQKPDTARAEQEKEQTTAHPQEMPALEAEPPRQPSEDPERPVEPRKRAAPDAPPPMAAGGTAAHADTSDHQAVQGAAAASAGAMRAYASRVMQALNKSKPKSAGVRGTVRISFALLSDGQLDFVRIVTSSGNARLDQVAIAAVRQASFPAPPDGMSALQRTFVLPYRFH